MKLQMFTKHVDQLTIYISNHYGVYPQLINVVCQLYFNKAEEKGRVEKIFLKERIVLKRSGYERPKVDVSEV